MQTQFVNVWLFERRLVIAFIAFVLGSVAAMAQNPAYEFTRTMGGDAREVAYAVAADANGNSYITGEFQDTVDFNPGAGVATLISVDSAGLPRNACFLASYDVLGNFRWAFRIDGNASSSGADIALDATGNVIVSGRFNGTCDFDPGANVVSLTGNNAAFIAKYSPIGDYLWAFPLNGSLIVQGISVDGEGSVAAIGDYLGTVDFNPGPSTNTLNASGGRFVVKYDAAGNYLWVLRINAAVAVSPPGSNQIAFSLMSGVDFDGTGNVVVAGWNSGSFFPNPSKPNSGLTTQTGATVIVKYSKTGKYLWATQIQNMYADDCRALEIDGGGNIVLAGGFSRTVDFNPGQGTANLTPVGGGDLFVARYSSNGTYLWAFQVGDTGTLEAHSMALGADNSIYVNGGIASTTDFDPGNGIMQVVGGGAVSNSTYARAYFVARYSSAGGFLWATGAGHGAGILTALHTGNNLAVDGSGGVHVAMGFNGTGDFHPGADSVESRSSTPITGTYIADIFLARFDVAPVPKPVVQADLQGNDRALHVTPNPFTSGFTISYDGASTPAQIQIFDMMGRVMESREMVDAGTEIMLGSELPAGAYLVQIVQGDVRRTMLVHKVK